MGEVDGKQIVTLIGNQSNTSDYHALYSKVINQTLLTYHALDSKCHHNHQMKPYAGFSIQYKISSIKHSKYRKQNILHDIRFRSSHHGQGHMGHTPHQSHNSSGGGGGGGGGHGGGTHRSMAY